MIQQVLIGRKPCKAFITLGSIMRNLLEKIQVSVFFKSILLKIKITQLVKL